MKHEHDMVTLLDPVLDQNIGCFDREVTQITEGILLLLPLLVHPYHCQLVAVYFSPSVDDIKAEVVIFRNIYPKITNRILV